MFCTGVLLISLYICQWVYFLSSSPLWNHSPFLFLSRPLFSPVSSGLLSSPVTCASATPIANSKNAVVVYIFTPACGSPQWHWPACEHAGEGEKKTWGTSRPHWDGCLASSGGCWITSCWQLSFPPFSHHDQAALLLAHTWLFVLDTFLFWAAASSVAWPPLCPCICQLSTSSSSLEGCRKSGLMAENNTG